ncbi:MAG: hypothetical protein L3K19_03760 [Thermoplasmata archaeon]|nr:hypothetical protein [Thermoplasmata archaeon]
MTSVRQLGGWVVTDEKDEWVPLAALGAPATPEDEVPEIPLAYVPRIPQGVNARELIERAAGWGRR